jgi:hypothetical protein
LGEPRQIRHILHERQRGNKSARLLVIKKW